MTNKTLGDRMGRVFLISDNHFSDYEKMFSDLGRDTEEFGFKSTAEMNRIMISNWNRVVHPEDTV
jgi:calcineurin-like phosphoesterase family protein